jgi:excisionase family DNA binding protein
MTDEVQLLLSEARELLAAVMRVVHAMEGQVGVPPLPPSEQVPAPVASPQQVQAPAAPEPPKAEIPVEKKFLQNEMASGKFMTVNEVCDILLIKKFTLYKMCGQNRFPHMRIGNQIKFSPKEVANYVKHRTTGPRVIKQST